MNFIEFFGRPAIIVQVNAGVLLITCFDDEINESNHG
jgi:hypothetical protein